MLLSYLCLLCCLQMQSVCLRDAMLARLSSLCLQLDNPVLAAHTISIAEPTGEWQVTDLHLTAY
jgi:hypothetical protein